MLSVNSIELDEYNWKRDDTRLESTHRTRSGRQFRYKWGEYSKVSFSTDQVDSSTACMINSIWLAGSIAVIARYGDVFSGYIVNQASPFARVTDARYDLWQGKIELETF